MHFAQIGIWSHKLWFQVFKFTFSKLEHNVGGVPPFRGSAIVATLSRGFTPTAMLFHPFGVRYVPIFPQVVEYFENRQQVVDDLGRKIRQQLVNDSRNIPQLVEKSEHIEPRRGEIA